MAEGFAGAKPKVPQEINSCIPTATSHTNIQNPVKHRPQSARSGQKVAYCKKLEPVASQNASEAADNRPHQNKPGRPTQSDSLASQHTGMDASNKKHVNELATLNYECDEKTCSVKPRPDVHLESGSSSQNGYMLENGEVLSLEDGDRCIPHSKVEEPKAVNGFSGSVNVAMVTVESDSGLLSSDSLSSEWRPTSAVGANQNEDNWSCGCDCNSQKCNCGGDWSFKVPRVLDHLDENKESTTATAQPCVGSGVGKSVGSCVGAQRGKSQKKARRNRKLSKERAGLLDSTLTSSDDEFEFVFDDKYGEIVCRRKSAPKKDPRVADPYLSALLSQPTESHNTDRDTSQPAPRADPDPLGSLKHALPYLPESLRTRLAARQTDHITSDHAGDTADNITVDQQTLTIPAGRMDANTERSCVNTDPTPEYVGSSCNTSKAASRDSDRSSNKAPIDIDRSSNKASRDSDRSSNKASRDIDTSSNKASRDIDTSSNKASRDIDRSSNKASRDIDTSSNKAFMDIDRSSNKAFRDIDTSSKDVYSRTPDSCSITTDYGQDGQRISSNRVIDSGSKDSVRSCQPCNLPETCDKDKQCNKERFGKNTTSDATSRRTTQNARGVVTEEADKVCSITDVPMARQGQAARQGQTARQGQAARQGQTARQGQAVRQGQAEVRWIDDDVLTFEDSLEDPFRVKDEGSDLDIKAAGRDLDMCSGLVDLIQDIDAPLVDRFDSDDDNIGRSHLANISADRNTRKSWLSNCLIGEKAGRAEDFNNSDNTTKRSSVSNNNNCFNDRDTKYEHSDTLQARYLDEENAPQPGAVGSVSDEISEVVSEVGLLGAVRDFASKVHDLCSSIRDLPTTQSPRSASDDALLWQSGSGSASDAGGDSCVEADDEFECDCDMCARLPQADLDPDLDLGASGEAGRLERLEEMRYGAETELPSPDSILRLTAEMDVDLGLGDVTEPASLLLDTSLQQIVLIESVIQQMLSLQPDLLSSMAPPAAPESVIDRLPTVALTPHTSEQHPTCPICLSPCEVGEEMTRLPCQHLFHPVCIRAWLTKSGTCPVCRQSVVG